METKADHGTDWSLLVDWQCVLPPNRPPEWWLSLVRARMRKLPRNSAVAVLGSTPEYRDILAQEGFRRVTVIDRSRAFYERSRSLRLRPSSQERFVESDWLTALAQMPSQFHAILSDLTLGNIQYDRQRSFCDFVSRAVVPGGLVLDRVLINPGGMKRLVALVPTYRHRPLNLRTLNDFNSDFLFTSELVEQAGHVDSSAIIEVLSSLRGEPEIQRLASRVTAITPKGCKWWYGRRWPEVATSYYPELRVLDARPSPPWEAFHGYVYGVVLAAPPLTGLLDHRTPDRLPELADVFWDGS